MKRLVVAVVCAALGASTPPRTDSAGVDARVEVLLQKMTLEEKIGQLNQVGGLAFGPNAVKPDEAIRKGLAGSVLWLSKPEDINRLQKIAMEESRMKIPLLFGLDVIHGYRTLFPMPLALAASWDMQLIEKVQSTAAKEARASGIAWTFAPMVDIARDPRWGRIIEGAGEDPYLGAAVARAQVHGFQGKDLSGDSLLACAKHFAGYGAADGGRDYDSSYISESQLWNVYLPPFAAAKEAGVATFMSAYMDLNDVPATGNAFLLQDVLRKTWKFDGFVVSDANSVRDLVAHGYARDAADAAYRGFTAGVDMDMNSGTYIRNLGDLVKAGKISEAKIDAAVRPILAAKIRLGLFEKPYADPAKASQAIAAPEHRQLARVAAQKAAVLLRNEGSRLPLAKTVKSVAVIGPLGDSKRDLLTMWSGFDVDPTPVVTLFEGMRNKLGANARVEFAPGVQIAKKFPSMFDSIMGGKPPAVWNESQRKAEFERAVELAKNSDVVVLTMGELAMMSAEMASQSTLELPGEQQRLMEAIVATGKPVVLVLVSGRPLNISWAAEHVPAILEVWHPGTEGGNAVADLLFGDANPGGKLPVTWPRHVGQVPIYYAHNLTHQPETARGFKSRYWDDVSSPLYPFGHGLSYSKFEYGNVKVSESATAVAVSVDVKNTSERAGEEVVQLYVHQRAGSASRPVRELKGFEKVALAAGQQKTVQFRLGPNELRYWSAAKKDWVQDPESFDVWVGADSNATLKSEFRVKPSGAQQ